MRDPDIQSEEQSSREEIVHLMNSYTYLIDHGDLAGFAALFDSGLWGAEEGPLITGQQMLEMLERDLIIYPDGTPRTRHVLSNVSVEFDLAKERASSTSYISLYQQTDDFPLQVIFSGEYHDEFARISGAWRFVTRIVKHPFYGDMSRHMKQTIQGE